MAAAGPSIFHLSFPVTNLPAALDFYIRCLGAESGRRREPGWSDLILFGHQLSLHERPAEVLPRSARGVRHFGAILSWDEWERIRTRALAYEPALQAGIQWQLRDTPQEHVKFLLEDPDGNLIEIKAYRSLDTISDRLADGA
jgi:uncharacterized protein